MIPRNRSQKWDHFEKREKRNAACTCRYSPSWHLLFLLELCEQGNAESKASEEICSLESPFEISGSAERDVEQRRDVWNHGHVNICKGQRYREL